MLVINPNTCGAVLNWVKNNPAGQRGGWRVYAPGDPVEGANRDQLHAKFIYIANLRKDNLSNGWLYLGSGNLSIQGLTGKVSDHAEKKTPGNIEAGVLLRVSSIRLDRLAGLLPIGEPIDNDHLPDGTGDEEDERGQLEPRDPPPVIAFLVDEQPERLRILHSSNIIPAMLILPSGTKVELKPEMDTVQVDRDATEAAVLEVIAGAESTRVPVIGRDGSFCRSPLKSKGFDQLLEQLTGYPTADDDEDDDDDDQDDGKDIGDDGKGPTKTRRKVGSADGQIADTVRRDDFPIHRAMTLVETIADRNQVVDPDMLRDWFRHLKFWLTQGVETSQIEAWTNLNVDFLVCLNDEAFAPPEVGRNLELAKKYHALWEETRRSWGFTDANAVSLIAPKTN